MINLKTFLKFFTILEIIVIDCGSSQELKDKNLHNNEYYFYYYDNDDVRNESAGNPLILSKDRLNIPSKAQIREVLDSIVARLTIHFQKSIEYLNIVGTSKIKIKFKDLEYIITEKKNYSIAIIEINDPKEICMSYFFQGSSGGQKTYNTLGTNLLQPNIEHHPLVDGVIILYNGIPMQPLDHINLSGILVPQFFEDAGYRAKLRNNN
jgi:hypothetical protein